MTPQDFVAKWKPSKLTERSAAHEHVLDLCEMLDQVTPAAADPDGTDFTFERGQQNRPALYLPHDDDLLHDFPKTSRR